MDNSRSSPPLGKSWGRMYLLVLLFLLFSVVVFTVLTKVYE
jgi:hypothetical protein